MDADSYIKVTDFFREKKSRKTFLKVISRLLPLAVAGIYAVLSVYTLFTDAKKAQLIITVPLCIFLCITVLRKFLNSPRPYDVYDFVPLASYRKGKGKSFPSRHTASAFVIAFSCIGTGFVFWGFFLLGCAFLIGLSRVLSGVHFPKDIIGAFIITLIWTVLGFYILT